MSCLRRRPRSPEVKTPLEDDDLLGEILLRLPSQPSSLPRASAVCRRWHSLASDPRFSRRFRLHHRRKPPLLGFFQAFGDLPFLPTLESPNRVPPGRFSFNAEDGDDVDGDGYTSLGCRHGLLLISVPKRLQILVWDPATGDRNRVALPAAFDRKDIQINGAVLRDAGDDQQFQVVLAVADGEDEYHVEARACVYPSKTGLWGNLVSTPIPYQAFGSGSPIMVDMDNAVLIGSSLYWKLTGDLFGILEFDLEKQSLSVIGVPVPLDNHGNSSAIMRADGGGLGFIFVSDWSLQLWKRETDSDGLTSWGLGRTIELDKVISVRIRENRPQVILGYAEENNVVLVWTMIGLFMINLDSLKFKKLFETMKLYFYQPFESVYTAETCPGGGQDRAELLLNT